MAIDYQMLWQALNSRQQTYLKIVFEIDQRNEQFYRRDWTVSRNAHPPPADQWRWIAYDGTPDGEEDTELRQRLRKAGLVDQGTGATFESLANRNYLKRKWSEPDFLGHQTLFVQITRLGRKLIRESIEGSSQPPPKLKKGQLQEWHWDALAQVYAAAPNALEAVNDIRRFSWRTWERLRHYTPPLMREQKTNYQAGSYKSSYIITQEGIRFYETQYEQYQAMYPDVATEKPSNKILSEPDDPLDRLILLMKRKRAGRGMVETSREVGISPSKLTQIEKGVIKNQAELDAVFAWLGVDASEFRLDLGGSNGK